MANSTDLDQLKPTDLDLHCLQNRVYLGSAGQGLTCFDSSAHSRVLQIEKIRKITYLSLLVSSIKHYMLRRSLL